MATVVGAPWRAARFVEAEDELRVAGVPAGLELGLVAVASGALEDGPSDGELAALPSRQCRLEVAVGCRQGLGEGPGVGCRLGRSGGGGGPHGGGGRGGPAD